MVDTDSTKADFSPSDIAANGWVQTYLPEFLQSYALLMRLDRPIGTWLLLLPGWWAIAAAAGGIGKFDWNDVYLLFLFAFGAVTMRGAGCVVNDLWDRKIDAQVARTRNRPLASGAIGVAQALLLLFILLWIGLIILVQLSPTAIFLGIVSVALLVIYPLAKRFTWNPQFILGLAFNMGALMGWAAVTRAVEWPALFLYAGGILWTLGYDTIYAHQDKEDDAVIGMKSLALKLGANSRPWIALFYAGTAIFILLTGVVLKAGAIFYAFWALAAFHLIYQLTQWQEDIPANCLRLFRSNRDFGALVFLAFLFGFWY